MSAGWLRTVSGVALGLLLTGLAPAMAQMGPRGPGGPGGPRGPRGPGGPCGVGGCPPAYTLQQVLNARGQGGEQPETVGQLETGNDEQPATDGAPDITGQDREIADAHARVHDPENNFEPTDETIPQGTDVTIVDTREHDGQTYAQVRDAQGTTWWTHIGNLTSGLAITDGNALVRDPDNNFASTDEVIPIATPVTVLETREHNGRTYARVQEILPEGSTDTPRVWWTSQSNLGSDREFDPGMVPADQIPLDGLNDLQRTMAIIYNTRGAWLQEQADALGVEVADLAAVLHVESGGAGFTEDGRAIIRFEVHQFYNRWGVNNSRTFRDHYRYGSPSWTGHYWRESTSDSWLSFHGDQDDEWRVLDYSRDLSEGEAIESISMGIAQLMGFNHETLGYDTPRDMFDAMNSGIVPQLEGFIDFVENCGNCMTGLRNGNMTTFATGYNGEGQAAHYGELIQDASDAYAAVLRLRQQPQARN
jgi:hypothetical protein